MGHLINPIAFRLGWSRQWIDLYYVDSRFYPELLHRLLRFRYFLNCFFQASSRTQNFFDEYLVSHFRFTLDLKGFSLYIYYYNSRLDPTWYSFFDKICEKPYGLKFFPKKWADPPAFSPFNRKMLSLLFILYHYASNGVLDDLYANRLAFFKAFEHNLHPTEFVKDYRRDRHRKSGPLSPSEQECFLLLYSLRSYSIQEIGRRALRGFGLRLVNYEIVAQNFFRLIFMLHVSKPYFRTINYWLRFLGYYFFLNQPLKIYFLQITNDQISARFLAKFLAIRFSQGVSPRKTINPIRKDLRLSKRLASRLHYKERFAKSIAEDPLRDNTLTQFYVLARRFHVKLCSDLHSYWTFDHFFMARQLFSFLPKLVSPRRFPKIVFRRRWWRNSKKKKGLWSPS